MTNVHPKDRNKHVRQRKLQVSLAAVSLLVGCSTGKTPGGASLPPAPAPSNATAYIGTQAPGLWAMSIDTTQNVFSYQAQAAGALTVSGGMNQKNGVLDFGNASGVTLGRAVAQPAGGALLRPGGEFTSPVEMVQQSGCLPLTGKLRYIYAGVLNGIHAASSFDSDPGYGTFVVNTSSDATSWSFANLANYALPTLGGGGSVATVPGTENGQDPSIFSASCSTSDKQGAVTSTANASFPIDPNTNSPSLPTFHFNPGGAFVEDRSNGSSWVGFAMPQAAIKPGDVGAQNFRGFVLEDSTTTPIDTRTVAFTTPPAAGPTLVGGVFPNDDLNAIPLNEYSITLGTQDSVLNGVFPNATLTVVDVNAYCAQAAGADSSVKVGRDASGTEICTAAGVAVIGQLNGKYVMYFTSRDGTKDPGGSGVGATESFVIQFYLYQQ